MQGYIPSDPALDRFVRDNLNEAAYTLAQMRSNKTYDTSVPVVVDTDPRHNKTGDTVISMADFDQNNANGVIVFGTTGKDLFANHGNNSFIWGDDGNDSIRNYKSDVTISGGAGNDSIRISTEGFALRRNSLSGGEGKDTIEVIPASSDTYNPKDITIIGGKGDDYVSLPYREGTYKMQYTPGDGNDVVEGWHKFDTLYVAGSYYAESNNGDAIVRVGNGSITFKGFHDLYGYDRKIKVETVPADTFTPTTSGGGSDTQTGGGLTYTNSSSSKVTLGSNIEIGDASARTKAIRIMGNNIANTILGGTGKDTLYGNNGDDYIEGGAGNDRLYGQNDDDTLWGGTGNDTLSGGNGADLFLYTAGKDVITDFKAEDILQLGDGDDTYSKATLDNGDVEVTVGDGSIILTGAASLGSSLNILGKEISAELQWQLNGTTATYGTSGNTLVTVSGVKSLDGISLKDKVVTISAASLGTNKVTISSGYTLALGTDAAVPKTVAANYDANTMTYTGAGKTAGYTLANNAISYSAGTSKEFKFSGISDTATVKGFYVNTSKKTIAIGAVSVNSDKTIPVKLLSAPEGYKMELGASLPKATTVSANTYDAKTMTYKTAGKTGTYTLSSDGKTISYTAGTSKEFTFSGISDTATAKGFYVNTSKKTIAIGAAAVSSDKTIPVKLISAPAGYKMELGSSLPKATTVSANTYDAATMTYKTAGKTGTYTLSSDGKTISYTAGTSKEFTFSGISDTATAKGFYVNTSKKTIAIGAVSVSSDKTIPVQLLSAPTGYKMELGSSLPKATTISANTYDAKTMTYKTAGKTGTYTLSGDGKTISYSAGTSKEFKFSGISDTATTKGFYVNTSKKTIAIGAVSAKTDGTPVELLSAPDGYKMELGTSLSKAKTVGAATLEDGFYTAAGQTAGYTISSDAKTITYREALGTTLELSGVATKPTAPANDTVTLKPANFDKSLSVVSNDGGYVFSMAKGTYTGKTFVGSTDADTITNAGSNLKINAGKGDDSISNSGAGVTLTGGAGNDTLWGSDYNETFVYKSGDGNDVIGGFDNNDLLQITGTFTTAYDSAAGTVKFTVGTGSITLTDFTATTFNVNGDTYQISGKQLVKK